MKKNKYPIDIKFIKMFSTYEKLMRTAKCPSETYAALCLTSALEIMLATGVDREECHKLIKTAIDAVYDNKERIK